MSDTNTPVAEVADDLDAFSAEFFGQRTEQNGEAPLTPEPEARPDEPDDTSDPVEDDTTPEEDALATDDEPKADKPKKQSAQERIRELTAARREAERREAELAARLAELEAKVNGKQKEPEAPAPAPTAQADAGPHPDDLNEDGTEKYPLGEYDPKYIRDLTKHTIRVEREAAEKEAEEARKAEEAKAAEEALASEWTEKLAKAEETYPDMRERLDVLDETFGGIDPQYGEFLASAIMGMDAGPEVLYHLASNLDEAKQIVASGPTKAIIALGRLEARLMGGVEEVKKPKVSSAPPPPPSNRGAAPAVGMVAPDTDDLDAFEAIFFNTKKR